MAVAMSASSSTVIEWSTATSKHKTEDRAIVFRYASRFTPDFDRAPYTAKIGIEWPYSGSRGMPTTSERERMDRFEDLLAPEVEAGEFSVLAIVSTGGDLRAWVYYARSAEEFMLRLNRALQAEGPFPIDIQLSVEPGWDEYERFRSGVLPAGEG